MMRLMSVAHFVGQDGNYGLQGYSYQALRSSTF